MFRFDAKKAVQAACILLDVEGGRMSYFRLLKLLYIADRQSMKETGFPITLSHASALPHGPVPSEIYDLVKGSRTDAKEWSAYVRTHGYQVSTMPGTDPGRGKLSRYEICKLREVAERHEPFGDWELAEITHAFGEFVKHDPGSKASNPIPLGDILDEVGMSDHKADILEELRDKGNIDEFIASHQH
jgi:uncharacterized phage-associated protein